MTLGVILTSVCQSFSRHLRLNNYCVTSESFLSSLRSPSPLHLPHHLWCSCSTYSSILVETQRRVSMAVPAVEERTWRSVQMRCEKDEENPQASILILFDVLLGCCRRQPRSNFLESTWNLRNSVFSLLSAFPPLHCSHGFRYSYIRAQNVSAQIFTGDREWHDTKYSAAPLWLILETQPQALVAL